VFFFMVNSAFLYDILGQILAGEICRCVDTLAECTDVVFLVLHVQVIEAFLWVAKDEVERSADIAAK
jgi:hypothetical protein